MVEIIAKKRDGLELSERDISFFVNGINDGSVADYQAAAMLMAIRINGMTAEETTALTLAMMRSGHVADLSAIDGVKVDKHSTGGVGDTVTLVALPLAAACGCKIAKMSGRSLGHTGGTIDKMNSIGMRTDLSMDEIIAQVQSIGICVAEQSENLAPADGVLYALRDVTATVDSIPLVASSILSKKLATGAEAIVLDVKCGSGAIFEDEKDSEALAKAMSEIGHLAGKKVISLLTDMAQPLGNCIGNRLEVYEAVRLLNGEIKGGDLLKLSKFVAAKMLELGLGVGEKEADKRIDEALKDGEGLKKLREFVSAQGGEVDAIDDPELLLRGKMMDVLSAEEGWFSGADTATIGRAAQNLGAGRLKKTDVIDGDVGIIMRIRIGDRVEKGQAVATLVYKNDEKARESKEMLLAAIKIREEKPEKPRLIHKII
ncbi:MAG: thymidine phosphorylase [Christensenellales bacterium]